MADSIFDLTYFFSKAFSSLLLTTLTVGVADKVRSFLGVLVVSTDFEAVVVATDFAGVATLFAFEGVAAA